MILMKGAAAAGMSGLVIRYYGTDNLTERALLREVIQGGLSVDGDRRDDQAKRIIKELSEALERGKKKAHSHRAH